MNKSDVPEMIKILNEIIRESIETESESKIIDMINLSARAEVSIKKNSSDEVAALEKEISEIILKYKSNNLLTKKKIKMKTLVLFISAILFLGYSFRTQEFKQNISSGEITTPKLHCPPAPSFAETINNETKDGNETADDNDIDQSWYQRALNDIQKEEYNITYSEETSYYQSPNRRNNIRFIYHKDGFTAVPRDVRRETQDVRRKTQDGIRQTEDEWKIQFRITNYELGIEDNELKVAGNKAFIENEKIRIDYTNDEDGMRQDFIIKQKPEGEGALRLNIDAATDLNMDVKPDALRFRNEPGEDVLKYSSLKCWDANHRELNAHFEKQLQIANDKLQIEDPKSKQNPNPKSQILNQNKSKIQNPKSKIETNPKSFSIIVNDENAVYPITIDPLSTSPAWTAEINQDNAQFGSSVATAGDVNGDGYSDVIIGAVAYDNGQADEGAVFVYYGSATGLSATADWTAESNSVVALFGNSVSTAGDVNGDGYSDIIVGSYFFANGQSSEGRAFAWHGSASGLGANGTPTNADWSAESNQSNAYFGYDVSTAGDVNNDGYSDVIVGAQNYDNGQTDEGRAYVYHGSASGLSASANWTAENNQASSSFGISVSTAGDVNCDNYSDVVIGSHYFTNGQTNEGRAYVYHGSSSGLSLSTNSTVESNQASSRFGYSVSTAGDINADGYSDIIIGAPGYDSVQTDEGRVFVYNGSSSGINTAAYWTAESNQDSTDFGVSVSTAGDINGDGYADIITGAPYYDSLQTKQGRVFVWYGSSAGLGASGVPSNADWKFEVNQANANLGNSVATAGDINGDGISDVILSANLYDNGQTNEGRAYVFTGSAAGISEVVSFGSSPSSDFGYFGRSVSSAGDVNGDGLADVIAGAPFNGSNFEGKVYLFNGGLNGLNTNPVWTATGTGTDTEFGWIVSSAGDVNGDGFADVIIGNPRYTNGEYQEGRALVYHGSATGLSASPNWFAEGNQAGALFGISVAGAGDINGDGYSDVIVSATKYDSLESDEGRVFVYYGSSSGLSSNPNWTAESNQINAEFGNSAASAGDVNGDGYSDIIIGTESYDELSSNRGSALIWYGSASGLGPNGNPSNADWSGTPPAFADSFYGSGVASAGDVNADGYSDVIVGATLVSNPQTNEGKVYVYLGSSTGLPVIANWTAEIDVNYAKFGNSVSTCGDVNGDGYSDILIGASEYNNGQLYEGAVFAWYGSSTGLGANGTFSNADWKAESNMQPGYLGGSVSSAGDVNGDGYSDIVTGLIGFSTYKGRANLYYGNEIRGKNTVVKQYEFTTYNLIYSGTNTHYDGTVRFGLVCRSPFGNAKGKIVHEYKPSSIPFSGAVISRSVSSTGSGNFLQLGPGIELTDDETSLTPGNAYKWRARVQYNLAGNPYQKFGPWKYYSSYIPNKNCDFRPSDGSSITLNLTAFIQGFYNEGTNSMVTDTVKVYIRDNYLPYNIKDSATGVLNSNGTGTFVFRNGYGFTPYYIVVKHRNSTETWSKTGQSFGTGTLNYSFTTSSAQAFGNNQIQVDASPATFAIFSGDVNQDGTTDLNDIIQINNDANNFVSGYSVTDVTGNNLTDLDDVLITYNNASAFVSALKP